MAAKAPEREWTSGVCADILKRRKLITTPDYLKRKLEGDQVVFVYGHEMTGNRDHRVFEHSRFLGKAVTHSTEFVMMEDRVADFPIVFLKKGTPMVPQTLAPSKIKGEIYAVDPLTLLDLDEMMQNTYLFNRVERYVKCLDQEYPLRDNKTAKPFAKCWIYIGVPECWRTITQVASRFNSSELDWHYSFFPTKTKKDFSTQKPVEHIPHADWLAQMRLDDKIPF